MRQGIIFKTELLGIESVIKEVPEEIQRPLAEFYFKALLNSFRGILLASGNFTP